MNLIDFLRSLQFTLNTLSFMACIFLSAEYIFIVRIRKSPHPWSSYAVSLLLFAMACNRLQQISQVESISSNWQLISQTLVNCAILWAACMIPLVRKGTYKRLRFNQLQQVNESLRYSQSLLRSYLDEAPIVAYIKDKNLEVTHVNDGFARLFAEKPETAIGKTVLWGEPEGSHRRDQEILHGGGEKEVTQTLPLKNGAGTILDIRFPLVGPDNERMLGGIAVDITAQLKRKNRIDVLASIVELSPDAIYSLDQSGCVIAWNRAAEEMFGYSRDEIIGQSAMILMPEDRGHELFEMMDAFRSYPTTPQHCQSYRVSKDGVCKPVQIAAACVPDAQMHIAVITRDITQSKQVERQIKLLHDELNQKVKELSETNDSLQKARDEALEAASMKSVFVANISHELRTPLAGILAMSEVLATQSLDDDSRELLAMLSDAAQDLLLVVEDILDLARLEAGKTLIDRQAFSIRGLLHECSTQFSAAVSAKNLTWQSCVDDDVPALIQSDSAIIKQVLDKLVANAISFTKSGSITVSVSKATTDEDNPQLKFSVCDTGMGIEPDRLPQLFTPFARVSQTTEGIAGTGLGLALAKQLVELLNGQIGCVSEEGKGATFWFTIAVGAPHIHLDQSPLQLATPPLDFARYRVLSVDDSPVLSRFTLRQLEAIGVQAESAVTGRQAVEKVENDRFDVVLMDVYLPDMTGYEAARKIREIVAGREGGGAIIIALTGCAIASVREDSDSVFMDDFLEKPVTIERLKTKLAQALRDRDANG